jgi:peptidoglycan/xylan/chitin deacetylase (PgdA/CDA1 family)
MWLNAKVGRVKAKVNSLAVRYLNKRALRMRNEWPIISFSFDDFPVSAYCVGGKILDDYGCKATYYISLGMLDKVTVVGKIAGRQDLADLVQSHNELGCHTYSHCDAHCVDIEEYTRSILDNRNALSELLPDYRFESFAYPIGHATGKVKRLIAKEFLCGRGGNQTINAGVTDLNRLNAFFLDDRKGYDLAQVKKIIDFNCQKNGWLIFATHDIEDHPSRFGCTTRLFREIVDYSVKTGATIMPVGEACRILKSTGPTCQE